MLNGAGRQVYTVLVLLSAATALQVIATSMCPIELCEEIMEEEPSSHKHVVLKRICQVHRSPTEIIRYRNPRRPLQGMSPADVSVNQHDEELSTVVCSGDRSWGIFREHSSPNGALVSPSDGADAASESESEIEWSDETLSHVGDKVPGRFAHLNATEHSSPSPEHRSTSTAQHDLLYLTNDVNSFDCPEQQPFMCASENVFSEGSPERQRHFTRNRPRRVNKRRFSRSISSDRLSSRDMKIMVEDKAASADEREVVSPDSDYCVDSASENENEIQSSDETLSYIGGKVCSRFAELSTRSQQRSSRECRPATSTSQHDLSCSADDVNSFAQSDHRPDCPELMFASGNLFSDKSSERKSDFTRNRLRRPVPRRYFVRSISSDRLPPADEKRTVMVAKKDASADKVEKPTVCGDWHWPDEDHPMRTVSKCYVKACEPAQLRINPTKRYAICDM